MHRHASVPRKVKYAINSKPSSRPTAASRKLWYLWRGVRVRSHLSVLFLCGGLVVNLKPLSDTSHRRRSAPSLPPVLCMVQMMMLHASLPSSCIGFYLTSTACLWSSFHTLTPPPRSWAFEARVGAELCPAPPRCRPTSCRRNFELLLCAYIVPLYQKRAANIAVALSSQRASASETHTPIYLAPDSQNELKTNTGPPALLPPFTRAELN